MCKPVCYGHICKASGDCGAWIVIVYKGQKMIEFTSTELMEIYGILSRHYCDPDLCIDPNNELLTKLVGMIEDATIEPKQEELIDVEL